jgi:signal transduction histidine kinase
MLGPRDCHAALVGQRRLFVEILQQLVLIYLGVLVINLTLSGLLWRRNRNPLNRGLFIVWAASVLFFLSQGIPSQGKLWVSLSCLPAFIVSYTLSQLLARIAGVTIPKRLYIGALILSMPASVLGWALGAPFWVVALPPSVAAALPLLETPLRALLSRNLRVTIVGKTTLASALALGLHDLDFAFFRDKPEAAVTGFTIALLILFAISVSAPATILELVTEERTRVQQLNAFQRRFFSNVTHELRTPLTMILAPLDGMLTGEFGPLTAIQRSYLEAGRRNGLRLLKLINDLLDLAKLEEGFLHLRREPTDLKSLLQALVDDARPLAAHKQLQVELIVQDLPAQANVDVEKIERVFINLISNAIKFTESGAVTVRASGDQNHVQISVEDTGIGIAPEHLPHLFERFNQGDASVTRRFGGTGIGLAYAKEIVELHGGHISVDRDREKGSRFVVDLAVGREPGAAPAPASPASLPSSSYLLPEAEPDAMPLDWALRMQRQKDYRFAEAADTVAQNADVGHGLFARGGARILVVEDNADIMALLSQQVGQDHAVHMARDGEEGLEIARRERPDLIITDFMMPKMDGLTMLRELRDDPKLGDVPVIMLTSKNLLEDRLSAREAGADVYLSKPFSPRELQAAVKQQLQKHGRHVQNVMRAHVEGLEIVSAGLAHEIQNPLNFIKNAQMLIAENVEKLRAAMNTLPAGGDPARTATVEKAQEKIGRMVASAGRGVQRIEDVVSLMRRYAREGYPTEASDVDLDQAVRDVVELVAPHGDVECAIDLDLGAAGATVHAVTEDLNQVIRSLVQNAIEAVGPNDGKGRIKLRTRTTDKDVIVEVSDNGPGIAPADLRRIFSPFYSTKAGSGRGLGLPIVQIVVARAGGTVEVTSVAKVETTFRVTLPLGKTISAPVRDRAGAAAASAPSAF